jgi:signal transduction histidine kinase
MLVKTVWSALGGSPLRFLGSSWPWRGLAYVTTGAAFGPALFVVIGVSVAVGLATTPFAVGVLVLVGVVLIGVPVGEVERRRLRLMSPRSPVGSAHRAPSRPGPRSWAATRLREGQTWWELGYALLLAGPLWMLDLLVLGVPLLICAILLAAPALRHVDGGTMVIVDRVVVDTTAEAWLTAAAGVPLLVLVLYLVTAYAGARAALARALLVPADPRLRAELVRTTRSRARLVDAFEAERRRIERDLHDGAQQQLLGVCVELGLARLEVTEPRAGGAPIDRIDRAQAHAKQAMADLRALIRGIHPQVLTDRGLPAAVAVAADRLDVPVDISVELPRRPPAAIESAVYFAVCEAFANISKHSGATAASVQGGLEDDRLVLEVRDNGAGGAHIDAGTGLVGLADRLAVVGGSMLLSSPRGGPTVIRMEIPCPGSE